MDEEDELHELPGSSSTAGGLIVNKKSTTAPKAAPQASKFGLDKLAAERRKEEEAKRLISFDYSDETNEFKRPLDDVRKLKRHYRETNAETPTYTGGVSSKARERLNEIEKKKREKKQHNVSSSKDRSRDRDGDRGGDRRDNRRDRRYDDRRSDRRSNRRGDSIRSVQTPYRDEPKSSRLGSSSWDDDDEREATRKSAWDFPTPQSRKSEDRMMEWSERKR